MSRDVRKFKMADAKPETLTYPLWSGVESKFQRLNVCFLVRPVQPTYFRNCPMSPDLRKFKMTAAKLEILISPLWSEVEAKFQLLNIRFRVRSMSLVSADVTFMHLCVLAFAYHLAVSETTFNEPEQNIITECIHYSAQ